MVGVPRRSEEEVREAVHVRQRISPVSYTHLDVYKRQDHAVASLLHPSVELIPVTGETEHEAVVPIGGLGPVSYTHLDVYKRQRTDRSIHCYSTRHSGRLISGHEDGPNDLRHHGEGGQRSLLLARRWMDRHASSPQCPVSYTHLDVYKRQAHHITAHSYGDAALYLRKPRKLLRRQSMELVA